MALARKLTTKIYEIKAHNGNVSCLDLGETGRVLVTGGQDRNVNLWAIGEEKCFMSLTGHNRPIDCVKFAYNDDFVYSADDIGIIRRWDLNAQTICSTLNGHMKSVRSLDFNPSGEYVVSGSNDTTVRLWDVRNQNKCIKIYRGHISHVNSVKFSPDGLWIASAGTEGSVIIWDIRKSKQIIDFSEQPAEAAISCIQYHPFEFLLAVGRIDGRVSIYDLESKIRISKTDSTTPFNGHSVKCLTFSENGECLFVGTSAGISVIGWEPDREFDHIKSPWTTLCDMKLANRKLICGSCEQEYVTINALNVDRVIPFYNPSNASFSHNQTTRKSFSRGNQKLRLSIGSTKPSQLTEENEDKSPSLDGQSSPNLSLELVDDIEDKMSTVSNGVGHSQPIYDKNITLSNKNSNPYNFLPVNSSTGYSSLSGSYEGPSSLKMPGEKELYKFNQVIDTFNNDVEYNMNDSNPPIISNYDHNELVEDFPVNNAQIPDFALPSVVGSNHNHSTSTAISSHQHHHNSHHSTSSAQRVFKSKTTSQIQKRTTQTTSTRSGNSNFQNRKLSQVSSMSTTELHKLDDNSMLRKSTSTQMGRVKRTTVSGVDANHVNKENARNKNITVQIFTKPPTRSRTSLDLRTPPQQSATTKATATQQMQRISSYTADTHTISTSTSASSRSDFVFTQPHSQKSNNNRFDDTAELELLAASHDSVFQELRNRLATLQILQKTMRSQDMITTLKQGLKAGGHPIFVDLLGAILEKPTSWNLDLCLVLLPEIYELLQSEQKFHYTRACDALRLILSNFLPVIRENISPWAANGLGVDVTREERQQKCIECQRWLLQIRNLPDNNHGGKILTQLQNLIANI